MTLEQIVLIGITPLSALLIGAFVVLLARHDRRQLAHQAARDAKR